MYKKILAFLFIGVMVIALAACGESGSAAKQNPNSESQANGETIAANDEDDESKTPAEGKVNKEKMTIALNLQIDENICTMFEYFDIFLGRMMMCRGAAEILGARFKLTANGSKVL